MVTICLEVTGTLKGPQIPTAYNFDTRCDVFINRYGQMLDSKSNELVSLTRFSNNVMVFVYCMGRKHNATDIKEILTIQQINAIKNMMYWLDTTELMYGPTLQNVSTFQ